MSKKFSILKRLKSFTYAGKGIANFIHSEHNAWIHCAAVILVTTLGFLFCLSSVEWIAIVICFAIVLAAEAFNTAFERLVNLVSPEHNNLAGEVKDIAAGAVLICAIAAAVVGILIFAPHFVNMFG